MKRLFAFICATSVLLSGTGGIPTFAETTTVYEETVEEDPIVTATYLISYKYLSISKSGTTLYITARTESSSVMKYIGFKDITVEYSTDQTNWYQYSYIDEILNADSKNSRITNYPISVTNGYYYRVTLNHYAKETGWFGNSQSVPNTSNVVS